MKMIIDIPEEVKQAFDCAERNDLKGGYYDCGGVIGNAIRNGTPLPKGHGRLIEADENLYQEIRKWVGVGVAFDIIENAPTIIEADKGDKE
jgi:hypothetical protein